VAAPALTGARVAAFALLLRAARSSRHLDLSLAAARELRDLNERDAGLAYELTSGTLKRRNSLDAVLRQASRPDLRSVPIDVLTALRLGAYQLLYLDRVPEHAAVDESVSLVARRGAATRGFVNAVLRAVAHDGRERLVQLTTGDDLRSTALRLSHPEWLVKLLGAELGEAAAEALMAAANAPPERCVRVNPLVGDADAAVARLAADRVRAVPVPGLDGALLVDGPAVERSAAFRDGLVTPQSRGSQLAGEVAAETLPAGATVADLCAAPGLKTSQLAVAVPAARILAVEQDGPRADDLRATLERLHVDGVDVRVQDARGLPADFDGTFDGVLLDAPCTGLGTLASRPDLRWRRRPADVDRLAALQRELLLRATALVRPGGALTYAVCTLTRAETTAVVDELLAHGGWELDDLAPAHAGVAHPERGGTLLTLPPRHGSSGFFIARLRRSE
jgi:16S rRNA (cytosine967-C5)-methyltransferase